MNCLPFSKGLLAAAFISLTGVQDSKAQLPNLSEQPWIGYFVGYENARYRFGVSGVGKLLLTPMIGRNQPISPFLAVDIQVGILETLPDGKTVMKQIKVDSLESSEKPTDELEKIVLRAKVTGDAAFETTIEQVRGVISIGGRIVDPGTLKNPLKFVVRATFPTIYRNTVLTDKRAEKAFLKKIEDDEIALKWTDGSRKKISFDKAVLASTPEFNGPGIAEIEVESAGYRGSTFVFAATEGSSMTLWNSKESQLHEGFSINWFADPEKDKDGKARFTFLVK
jgi:hypothetical protein